MRSAIKWIQIEGMYRLCHYFMLFAFSASVLTSCYVSKTGVYAWEDSNPSLIEKSIPTEEVAYLMDSLLTDRDRLVVLSQEMSRSTDNNLTVAIENQLVQSLVVNDVFVLERDDDILLRLMGESAPEFTYLTKNKSSYSGVAASGSSGGSKLVGEEFVGSSYAHSSAGAMTSGVENWARAVQTQLPSATKLLTYRVVECGIQRGVKSREGELDEDKLITRMAMTVLDLKLVDASTGQIVFADRIAGNAQSEGLKGDFDRRKDPRYRFYSHGNPLQNGNPSEQEVVKEIDPDLSEAPNLRILQGLLGVAGVGTFLFFVLGG